MLPWILPYAASDGVSIYVKMPMVMPVIECATYHAQGFAIHGATVNARKDYGTRNPCGKRSDANLWRRNTVERHVGWLLWIGLKPLALRYSRIWVRWRLLLAMRLSMSSWIVGRQLRRVVRVCVAHVGTKGTRKHQEKPEDIWTGRPRFRERPGW